MLATGQTPFDLAGVELSASGAPEMAVSVLALLMVLVAHE